MSTGNDVCNLPDEVQPNQRLEVFNYLVFKIVKFLTAVDLSPFLLNYGSYYVYYVNTILRNHCIHVRLFQCISAPRPTNSFLIVSCEISTFLFLPSM